MAASIASPSFCPFFLRRYLAETGIRVMIPEASSWEQRSCLPTVSEFQPFLDMHTCMMYVYQYMYIFSLFGFFLSGLDLSP